MKSLESLLKNSQSGLFAMLCKMFKDNAISSKGNYVLVKGEAPIMLLAHLDTVHREPVQLICTSADGNIIMSPQGIGGDDRCGVYALLTAYEKSEQKPWLLFTCDEEVGGVGADMFCKHFRSGKLPIELSGLKMLIEIDRKGEKDAVYYDCANREFEAYITGKGFKTEYGSFSDISLVAPELGVAAVNLSSGYYNPHTQHEFINRRQLNATTQKVIEIVAETAEPDFPKYEYVEEFEPICFGGSRYASNYYGRFSGFDDKELEEFTDRLEEVPEELREIYIELLDLGWYSFDELEEYRNECGNIAIVELYHSDIGYPGDDEDDGEVDEFGKKGGARYA